MGFTVTEEGAAPRRAMEPERSAAEAPPALPAAATRGRVAPAASCDVLVVEDDEGIREQLTEILRFEGYTVATAENGKEALEQLERRRVGVMILDLMLPVMSGWELMTTVRATPRLANIPVLTITAVTNAHRGPGGPLFLKPLNLDSLLRAVSLYLKR